MLNFLTDGVATEITFETFKPIIDAVTNQFSPTDVVALIGGIVGAGAVFVFLWWGARKGFRAIKNAVLKGKLNF